MLYGFDSLQKSMIFGVPKNHASDFLGPVGPYESSKQKV